GKRDSRDLDSAPSRFPSAQERAYETRCSGEVSQDGQPWTTSAYANEFTQRAWTLSYSRHGRVDTEDRIGEQSTPYIWELATKKGLRVRTYGMGTRRGVADIRSLRYEQVTPEPGQPRPRDTERAARFIEEFEQMDRDGTVQLHVHVARRESHQRHDARVVHAEGDGRVERPRGRPHRRDNHEEQGLARVRDLHHRGRCAERTGPCGLPPDSGARHQPVREAPGGGQHDVLHRQHAAHRGAAPWSAVDDAARRGRAADGDSFMAKPDLTGFNVVP